MNRNQYYLLMEGIAPLDRAAEWLHNKAKPHRKKVRERIVAQGKSAPHKGTPIPALRSAKNLKKNINRVVELSNKISAAEEGSRKVINKSSPYLRSAAKVLSLAGGAYLAHRGVNIFRHNPPTKHARIIKHLSAHGKKYVAGAAGLTGLSLLNNRRKRNKSDN